MNGFNPSIPFIYRRRKGEVWNREGRMANMFICGLIGLVIGEPERLSREPTLKR
jgi:hypothetical protein